MKCDAETVTALIRRRIESRYRRIRFVYQELAKVDARIRAESRPADSGPSVYPAGPAAPANAAAGKSGPPGAKSGAAYGGSFEDLVFSTIDFSVYRKIDAEEFSLLFDEGLEDFAETFYQKAFKTNRENIRKTIFRFYLKAGPFYVCRKINPLILSIMRSVHTSLEFAPLLAPDDLDEDSAGQYGAIIAALDGVAIRHDDGMETRLFIRRPETAKTAAEMNGKAAPLWGTFHPFGKAHTIPLL
ncbi:MAG: hypothetical protein LBH35_08855 [Treponema sp.]|jgi:hypothetical protein|nr:hypothetical protein [Treponema sp.]